MYCTKPNDGNVVIHISYPKKHQKCGQFYHHQTCTQPSCGYSYSRIFQISLVLKPVNRCHHQDVVFIITFFKCVCTEIPKKMNRTWWSKIMGSGGKNLWKIGADLCSSELQRSTSSHCLDSIIWLKFISSSRAMKWPSIGARLAYIRFFMNNTVNLLTRSIILHWPS